MEQRRGQVAAHALAQAELAHGHVQERLKVEYLDHLVTCLLIIRLWDAVDVAARPRLKTLVTWSMVAPRRNSSGAMNLVDP